VIPYISQYMKLLVPVLAALSASAKRYNCRVMVDRTISYNKIVVKIGQAATGED
jgi:hypothetical protein